MTRTKLMLLTAGVWVLAAGSAAALTVDLSRPPVSRTTALDDMTTIHKEAPETRRAAQEAQRISVPPITIVGRAPRRLAAVPVAPTAEPLPDITRMHCGEWRDLQMGSGRVQTCE